MADISITAKRIRPLLPSMIVRLQAAATMTLGTMVYVNSDGKAAKTDADAAVSSSGLVGMVVSGALADKDGDIAADEWCDVVIVGRVGGGFASLDETKTLYLSATAGALADAAGTVTRAVGWVESTTVIFLNPNVTASS